MKKFVLFLLLVSLFVVNFGGKTSASAGTSLTYYVWVIPGEPKRVEAVLEGVSANSVTFRMISDGNTGIDLLGNISNVEALGPDGSSLPVVQRGDGWRVSTQGETKLTFRYSFGTSLRDSREEGYGVYYAHVTGGGAFFNNRVIFAFPDIPLQEIRVTFDKPENWTIGTSFISEGPNTFRVEGVPDLKTDLIDNVTRMGVAPYVVTEKCGDLDITFIAYRGGYSEFWHSEYGNTIEEQMHEYIQLVCATIQYLSPRMGGWPGGSRYWISNMPTDNELPCAWDRWMQAWPRERYDQVPHHVLHAWIWWRENAPIQTNAPEWMWIQEGIPTFYQRRLTPLLTGDDIWGAKVYSNYLITKRAAQFGLLDKPTINHYSLGEMRVVYLDWKIRETTNGEKSIDDLLFLLANRYGIKRQHFSREEIIQAINEVSGTDLRKEYSRYIAGRVSSELPPVDDLMVETESEYLRWIDKFLSSPGAQEASGSRTMFFVALEIGIQAGWGVTSEHFVGDGSGIYNLGRFRGNMKGLGHSATEKDVIEVLSSITGVPEDDFFDFYTVGDYRPSVEEIKDCLLGEKYVAPPQKNATPTVILTPTQTTIPTQVPTETVTPTLSPLAVFLSRFNIVKIAPWLVMFLVLVIGALFLLKKQSRR